MSAYVDGYVFPIPSNKLSEYKQLAERVALIWKEHGALDYREYVADDLHLDGTRSFDELMNSDETETIIFGYVTFASRSARDLANQSVPNDPRVSEIINSTNTGFDVSRMFYGGFKSLV